MGRIKNALVACEESQVVCAELRKVGIKAFSCDIQKCSGGHAEWHICGDVLTILNGDCHFKTMDGEKHTINGQWDMVIAHPPCTHLAVSGARHFEKKRASGVQRDAILFFCAFLVADCKRMCIENPVGIMSGEYIKTYYPDICEKYSLPKEPTQYIQPYEYGDPYRKRTCLWLKGLPRLKPTDIVQPELVSYTCRNGKKVTFSRDYVKASGNRGKIRSKTYAGVARAMAEQWGRG